MHFEEMVCQLSKWPIFSRIVAGTAVPGLQIMPSPFDKLRAGSAGLLRIAAYSSRRTCRGFWPRMRKLAAQPVAVANTAVPTSAIAVASHSM
jgi:hypothetical protein